MEILDRFLLLLSIFKFIAYNQYFEPLVCKINQNLRAELKSEFVK